MSVALREIHKEFSTAGMKENQFHFDGAVTGMKEQISDNLFKNERLLLSSDNKRPKSKSKTCLTNNDLQLLPLFDNHSLNNNSAHLTAISPISIPRNSAKEKNQNCSEVLGPSFAKESTNYSHNAQDAQTPEEGKKKGKKTRKRSNSFTKIKKGKHGRQLSLATGLHHADKRPSLPLKTAQTSNHQSKPSRVSSEPPSKIPPSSILSLTLQTNDRLLDSHKQILLPNASRPLHDIYPNSRTNASSSTIVPSNEIHYMHGNPYSDISLVSNNSPPDLLTQGLAVYKVDVGHRMSASSVKSLSTLPNENTMLSTNTELSLNSVTCAIHNGRRLSGNRGTGKYQHEASKTQPMPGPSNNSLDQIINTEEVLSPIYGTVYQTADKITAQIEELKKVKKIYLSEKQSGSIRESGMEYPCAPPATPTPDVLKHHEFVPSMSDVRSQRAVKGRLLVLEKEAQKKLEKQKEANVRHEKQQQKDKERTHKIRQRRQIYLLNQVMTELENKRFLEFCKSKGLNNKV